MTQTGQSPSILPKRRGSYRRWSKEEKRRIVEETLVSGASVSIVARRHDINGNQLFTWRQQYRRGELSAQMNTLVPVGTVGSDGMIHSEVQRDTEVIAKASLSATTTPAVPARIEIELPGGIKVRVDGNAQAPVLDRVVKLARGLSC